jgi:branched-chain amino acid transport system ATP-binding protein
MTETNSGNILEISDLSAGYGDITILRQISLQVPGGSIIAIIGSNGAGKTTLMRTISGLIPAADGRIAYAGRDITRLKPSERVAAGISLVPEGRLIFADFTVAENLAIGAFTPRARQARQQTLDRLYAHYPLLAERRRQRGGTLSGGEQQTLAIARALMSRPRLLLLDEPSLGLAPKPVAQLFEAIEEIRRSGVTVVLVEQNVRATLEIADHAFVLENGRVEISGPARDLLADPRVQQAYLGL